MQRNTFEVSHKTLKRKIQKKNSLHTKTIGDNNAQKFRVARTQFSEKVFDDALIRTLKK